MLRGGVFLAVLLQVAAPVPCYCGLVCFFWFFDFCARPPFTFPSVDVFPFEGVLSVVPSFASAGTSPVPFYFLCPTCDCLKTLCKNLPSQLVLFLTCIYPSPPRLTDKVPSSCASDTPRSRCLLLFAGPPKGAYIAASRVRKSETDRSCLVLPF